jgi:hypothetical protein
VSRSMAVRLHRISSAPEPRCSVRSRVEVLDWRGALGYRALDASILSEEMKKFRSHLMVED